MPGKPNKKNISPIKQQHPKAAATIVNDPTDSIPKWAPAAIIIFTFLLYSNALQNGITYMDDDYYLLKNPYIKDFSWHGVKAIFTTFFNYNYHPFTTLTWLLEYTYFGLNPLSYHLLNVLLHLLNTWLAFKLTEQLSGKKIAALVVSVLFAVHPMHVESVTWISERKDVLYAAFYLLSLLCYLQYIDSGFRRKYYAGTLLLFLASLFSKSAAVTLPVLLIVIDWYKGRRINTKSLLEKVPFFLLSVLFGILTVMSQSKGGAIADVSYSFINRIFLFTSGIASYLLWVAAPFHLCAFHYFPNINNGLLPWYYYLSLPFLAGIAWLVKKATAYRKEIVFGAFFFLITISIMLQVVAVGSALTAERYTYIPYIGLFYIAGIWIANNIKGRYRNTIIGTGMIVLIVFSATTWERIGVWKDTNVLFTDVVEKNQGNWHTAFLYNAWGEFKNNEGDVHSAIQDYSKAIELYPIYERAYYDRGLVYDKTGNVTAALNDFNKAIQLNPKQAHNYNGRGWVYYETGDKKSAMPDFNKAISLDPDYTEAYNNRGWAYYEAGDIRSAMEDFSKAIILAPEFPKPYYNRAVIEVNTGNFNAAIEDYNSILKYYPTDSLAYFNRGLIHFNLKDAAGACADWRRSAELGYKRSSEMLKQYCH